MNQKLSAASAGQITLGSFTVNRIGLGTNRITDTEQAHAVLRKAVELGVNFIDTADIYQRNASEETISKTLAPYPSGLIIATKGGMSPQDSSAINDPEYLRKALEGSMKRLKLSRIELYQLHRVDPKVPIEDTVGLLKRFQDEGKIANIGLSEVTVEQIERAQKVADIVSVQNQYNFMERKHEAVLNYCEANGIVFIPWYPLAKGKPNSEVLTKIASEHSASQVQIALAWLLHRSPVMLPIPGTLSIEHLESNIAAANIKLNEEELEELSDLKAHQ
jgi:pyridoxine 4-dehydrogenase